jgi:hypothetical protein
MFHKLWWGGETLEPTWHPWFPHASPAPCCHFFWLWRHQWLEPICKCCTFKLCITSALWPILHPGDPCVVEMETSCGNGTVHTFTLTAQALQICSGYAQSPFKNFLLTFIVCYVWFIAVPNTCQTNTLKNKSDYLCIISQWFPQWLFLASAWHVIFWSLGPSLFNILHLNFARVLYLVTKYSFTVCHFTSDCQSIPF